MKLIGISVLVVVGFICILLPVKVEGQLLGPCNPDSCLNGGTCTDLFGRVHFCTCRPRYIGDNCEKERPCISNPCSENAECVDNEPHYENRTCICDENYGGDSCEIAFPCTSNPCQNGGTCYNAEDLQDFTCDCPSTHMGKYCQYGALNLEGVCGTTPGIQPMPRFFGGEQAELGSWPWQGYIKFARGINYGVTLISDQWAITSAGNTEYLSTVTALDEVVFGDVFQGNGEDESNYRQVAIVEKVVTFPGLNYFTFEGDAQLLKFTEPLEITDYVRPICLPPEDVDEVEDYDACWVTGWGQNEDGEVNTLLEQARTYVSDYKNCSETIKDLDGPILATENMICTSTTTQGVGPCLGDGGNAVSCSRDGVWEVAGIVSFGYACGDPGSPVVNWRTASYLDFIEAVVSGEDDQGYSDLCEPTDLKECEDLLPYSMTYKTSQESFANLLYAGLDLAQYSIDTGYCDMKELTFLLCALSLGECKEDNQPSIVICRNYCEEVRYRCNLTDFVQMCNNLPYGEYGDKWCMEGEDVSCGDPYIIVDGSEDVHLASPMYPYAYPSIRRCFWHVSAPEGYVLQIQFGFLEIDNDADFLSIGEGDPYDLSTPSIRFDGNSVPAIWNAEGNSIWIRFQTNDGPGSGSGFSLYLLALPPGGRVCQDTDVFCDDTCYFYDIGCDFVVDCMDGTDEEGCDEITVPRDGTNFTSPFYPAPGYPTDFEYTWTVSVPPGYYFGLGFTPLDLEYQADFLSVSNCEDEEPLYTFTGYHSLIRILPAYETLCVSLKTDDNKGKFNSGFFAYAYPINATAADDDRCEADYEFDCGDGVCVSSFAYCDGFQHCSNGADESMCPPTTCDDGKVIPYGETCNFVWFCDYGEDELSCPPRKLGEEFYLSTPTNPYNYSEYLPNSEAVYTIAAEEGLSFSISYPYFYTETAYDLWILGLGNRPDEAFVTDVFSGFVNPGPMLVESNKFFVFFSSDGSKSQGGVTMKVEVVNKADLLYCEKGTFVHESQICNGFWDCLDGRDEEDCKSLGRLEPVPITLPGWPILYPNNAEFKWTFKAEEGSKIFLRLPDFNTEEGFDVLRVGSGRACEEDYFREDSGVISNDYEVLSENETLCLYFSSDYSVGLRGFYGHLVALNDSDYYSCPEDDEEIVVYGDICDIEWKCQLTGQDERDCAPIPLGAVTPFASPGYPMYYPKNSSVLWTATTEEGLAFYVTFTEFELEEDVDFLTYGCGDNPYDESTIEAAFTGDDVPESLLLNCSGIWARFESDDKGLNKGFSGYVSTVDPNALPGDCVVPPGAPAHTVCDLVYQCEELAQSDLMCSVISEESVIVSSPNYPETYNDSASVISVFAVPKGYRILLNITDFALEEYFDYLFIGAELDTSSPKYLESLTGNELELPLVITSPGQTLFLKFESDEAIGDRGFYGSVMAVSEDDLFLCGNGQVVPYEEICNYEWYCEDGSDEMKCDGAPIGSQGELYLPGYPDGEDYENNLNITWSFTGEPGSKFVFTVEKLDLEDGFDFLVIGYGLAADENSILAKLTGGMENIPDAPVTTPSNEIWIRFISDDSFNLDGFFANIFVVPADIDICRPPPNSRPALVCEVLSQCKEFEGDLNCELLAEDQEVQVSSPNYPETYDNNSTITSVFVAPRGYRVLLNITDFATEAFFDFLTIRDKVNPDMEDFLYRLTGDEVDLPLTVVSPAQTLLLKFESDDAVGDMGYYGTVQLVSEEDFLFCDGKLVPPEELCNYQWFCSNGDDEQYCDLPPIGAGGPLASPGYSMGEDYENNLNLTWSFRSVPEGKFRVVLFDLDVEDSFDFLVIGHGDRPSRGTTLARLTGSIDDLEETVFETPENELWVRLMTDGAFNARGFYLNITVVEDVGLNCSDGSTVRDNALCNYRWDCPYGEDENDCDVLQEGEYALIYTPNFPDDYPSNANISWVIQAEEGLVLLANFTDFKTEGIFDVVTVGNGLVPCVEGTVIARFSGFNIPRDVFSEGNAMWVTFESDGGVNFSGFLANISAVNPDDFNTCYDGTLIPPSEICNNHWWCENGVDEQGYDISCPAFGLATKTNFSSPEFPYFFMEDTNVTWSFVADPGLQFNITIPTFDATNGTLMIGTGVDPTVTDSVLITLTGYSLEEENIVIPGNEMWARLEAPVSSLGFIAHVVTFLPGQGDDLCGLAFPCYNGGTCNFDNVFYPDGVCICPIFYTGQNCETHFCDSNGACLNGGTCDGTTTYCICPDGFGGDFCEFDNTVCVQSNPCPAGSECVPQFDGSALCQCPDGYQYEPDAACPVTEECTADRCLNGGTCMLDDTNSVVCDCVEGFGGPNCSISTVSVGETCSEFLNYAEARDVPLLELTLPLLSKELIANTLISDSTGTCSSLSDGSRRAFCAMLYPPLSPSMGPCQGACGNLISMCLNIGLLTSFDCSLMDYTVMVPGYPGLCTTA